MKKIVKILLVVLVFFGIYYYREDISNYIIRKFIVEKGLDIPEKNDYYQDLDYINLSHSENYIPGNKSELLNVIYSAANNGWNEFKFYCKETYKDCTKDALAIIADQNITSSINALVHPYNQYSSLAINYDNLGSIKLMFLKSYTDDKIKLIEKEVNNVYKELINDDMDAVEKVTIIHDYIVNNTVYDKQKANYLKGNTKIDSMYDSTTAYGAIIEGYGICSGYTDLMALFLNKMKIPNYRLYNDNHTWNYVYINGKWLHLDVTWNDPITSNNTNILLHDMFLLSDEDLKKLNVEEHDYNNNLFITENR